MYDHENTRGDQVLLIGSAERLGEDGLARVSHQHVGQQQNDILLPQKHGWSGLEWILK